jgi:hypothetical protein
VPYIPGLSRAPQVCFGMFMPTLLYTFLYSFPASGNIIIDAGM